MTLAFLQNLSKVQIAGIIVAVIAVIAIIIYFLKKEKYASSLEFQEQPVCRKIGSPDLVVYKSANPEFPFKVVNTLNLQRDIDNINNKINLAKEIQDKENTKLLTRKPSADCPAGKIMKNGSCVNLSWENFQDTRMFRRALLDIKQLYNTITTQCKNMIDVYAKNAQVIIASKREADFLINLDTYLNTVLYPYLVSIKLNDDDTSNDIYSIPVPQSFSEYNSNKPSMNNFFENQTVKALRIGDNIWERFIQDLDKYLARYPDHGFVKYSWMSEY